MSHLATQLNCHAKMLTDLQPLVLSQLEHDFTCLFDTISLPEPLDGACRYAVANHGKRVRPLLALASCLTVCPTHTPSMLDALRRVMMSVELIHGYSLVHDDLPCMDDDMLRRGKPTCHVVYGEAAALLAGDALQSLAFEILTITLPTLSVPVGQIDKLLCILAPRARRMVAGQQLDLNGEHQILNQQALQNIHQDKTGALIEAAVMMGGVCAGASETQMRQLTRYACTIGLAFQVQDDVLDVISDTATLGKPAGSDEKLQKSTYVRLLGINAACDYAKTLFDEARLSVVDFGEQNLLIQMADWLQKRSY